MATPIWDLHVHAAPSSTPRWGNDLDVVDAAAQLGFSGFVLKSHHESTAARAAIATEYARRIGSEIRVVGSVTLNPGLTAPLLDHAVGLGARMIWWPTADSRGRRAHLRRSALTDRALSALASTGGIAATGHLAASEASELIEDGAKVGLPVIVTHPFNPDVGVGAIAAEELGLAGGIVEVDTYSLTRPGVDIRGIAASLLRFRSRGVRMFISSDGGQAATGNPAAFLRQAAPLLVEAGFPHSRELHATAADLAKRLA